MTLGLAERTKDLLELLEVERDGAVGQGTTTQCRLPDTWFWPIDGA